MLLHLSLDLRRRPIAILRPLYKKTSIISYCYSTCPTTQEEEDCDTLKKIVIPERIFCVEILRTVSLVKHCSTSIIPLEFPFARIAYTSRRYEQSLTLSLQKYYHIFQFVYNNFVLLSSDPDQTNLTETA